MHEMQEYKPNPGTVAVVHFFSERTDGVVGHEYPVMEADILPLISPDGIVSLGNNSQYTLDEAGLIHLQTDVLQAAVDKEVHFLLHPAEEKPIAARVYTSLKGAYDAWVVGNKLADLKVI
jgi:hypothetical protein